MSVGDRGVPSNLGQDPCSYARKVLRLIAIGDVPEANPFVADPDFLAEIYTYGHRNIQGLVVDPATGHAWVTEHGPRGGDELNRIESGKNYGWPVVSRGRDYKREVPWGEARSRLGVEDPIVAFLTTLALFGLAVISRPNFQLWQGNLLAGGRKESGSSVWSLREGR
jgi:aldose sugar dehydrogenase